MMQINAERASAEVATFESEVAGQFMLSVHLHTSTLHMKAHPACIVP